MKEEAVGQKPGGLLQGYLVTLKQEDLEVTILTTAFSSSSLPAEDTAVGPVALMAL